VDAVRFFFGNPTNLFERRGRCDHALSLTPGPAPLVLEARFPALSPFLPFPPFFLHCSYCCIGPVRGREPLSSFFIRWRLQHFNPLFLGTFFFAGFSRAHMDLSSRCTFDRGGFVAWSPSPSPICSGLVGLCRLHFGPFSLFLFSPGRRAGALTLIWGLSLCFMALPFFLREP